MKETGHIPADFDDLSKHAPTLAGIEKRNCFVVPEHYFEGLGPVIHTGKYISSLPSKNPFSTPEGYFDLLPIMIQQRIAAEEAGAELDVPEGYFDELPNIIQSRLKLEELKGESGYEVPGDYFNTLAGRIQERLKEEKKETRVISFREYVFSRYTAVAIAASVALLLGWYTLFYKTAGEYIQPEVQMAGMDTVDTNNLVADAIAGLDEATLIEAATGSSEEEGNENTDVENYIIDNDIDISSMVKEL